LIFRTLLIILLAISTVEAYLPKDIAKMIKKLKINPNNVSIKITTTKGGKNIVLFQEYRSRVPASVMKILTTYSALLELGKDFRWPTRFFYTGDLVDGVIKGDLIIKGYGDPTLGCNDIYSIVNRIKALGIKKIAGDIIIDRTFFNIGDKIVSGFDHNRYSEYNAMPDSLMFDDHLCRIVVKPDKYKISVTKPLPDESFEIVNNLKATSRSCRGKYSWPRVSVNYSQDKPQVILSGYLSNRCSTKKIAWVIGHPYKSFYYVFVNTLKSRGIEYNGKMKLSKVTQDAKPLLTHYSKPLIDIIAKTNKKSINLYARHIFLMLGAKYFGEPATEEKGQKAVKAILGNRSLLDGGTIIENGSGLSRKARINADTLYRVLQSAYRDFGDSWLNSLAIAGKDGTIHRRFRHSIARGRAWMKTGTLKNAKNIAGYVLGKSGKLYTVVILYNGKYRWRGASLQNQIIEWIVRRL